MVFFDCRYYMPAPSAPASDYAVGHPTSKRVIASMGIEHLGQIRVEQQKGQPYHRTEMPELSSIWATNNQYLVDAAIKAVKDNHVARVQVQSPGRPGMHGKDQGPWYGLGGIARRLGIPGYGVMGLLSAYWTTRARLDYLDANHFVRQSAALAQICGGSCPLILP